MNFYARLRALVRPPASAKPPDYIWSGTHPLTTIATYRLVISANVGNRGHARATAFAVQRYFVPSTPVCEWSRERRDRVDVWKRILTPPPTHIVFISYEIAATGKYHPLLEIDLNLTIPRFSPREAARQLGTYLVHIFERVENKWLLYEGEQSEMFWLMTIERKCADLLTIDRAESVDSPKPSVHIKKLNSGGNDRGRP